MKKAFLFRLFAITLFCLASLAIKSESSSCKSVRSCILEDMGPARLSILNAEMENHFYKYDAFIIKI